MANASSKRIASANETALKNLELGLLVVNVLSPLSRLILSLITSRSFVPRKLVIFLHIVFVGSSIVTWRWFKTIGTPSRGGSGGVRVGEDLGGKGVVELGWDLIYMTWICTLGSAILGDWVWWLSLLIPAFASYKLFSTIRPLLAMFLPGLFGPKSPQTQAQTQAQAQQQAQGNAGDDKPESKRQAKLKARMERGDKRVQQVQVKQSR
ncbi:hypothetical protein I302_104814 [Kwoniella bestiolae CBS 10118]|uniref:DUF788-domain-containing protein n=1 Tax=Kwoniella bestiolae CBS 10118 TaxID=1296100 RepID=A0A1B9FRP3_9TREE|nr:hypothetical protein I302_09117 [Kwoniella bestiolae CBS 10118]OCF21438.1 hypothetical protein I302_09117 [Kwoniella bestiolae CBS 10118]